MGVEEQKEEREVLDSIFPEEITEVSDTEFRISIQLDITPEGEDDPPSPVIVLHVVYPESYPDEAPRLDIERPANAAKHPQLDIQDDKARLLESLQSSIEENIGMAMIFTVVNTLKDSAEQLIAERKQAIVEVKEKAAAEAEAEENRKFEGTKVTKESFLRWQAGFKKEMEEERLRKEQEREEELKKKRVSKEEKKMTGKELWEKGLAGKIMDEDEEGDDAIEQLSQLKVK